MDNMERYIPFTPGEFYHVYNRGVDKNKIFFTENDQRYFQRLLYLRNNTDGHLRPERCKNKALLEIVIEKPLVNIQAYALMPNHFHLLLSEIEPGGITTYMRRLLTSYSMYMNKKYDRSGPLMCRPFRARQVDSDEYLRWLISYVHLNPIDLVESEWKERGIADIEQAQTFLREYPYSSYCDYYVTDRDETSIIEKESLPFFISDLEQVGSMFATYQQPLLV